jgi:hypothetical protein
MEKGARRTGVEMQINSKNHTCGKKVSECRVRECVREIMLASISLLLISCAIEYNTSMSALQICMAMPPSNQSCTSCAQMYFVCLRYCIHEIFYREQSCMRAFARVALNLVH